MKQVSKIYLTPTPVRIWHWLNAFGILTLTATGAQIRFPEYVNLFGTYKAAIALHDAAGMVVAVSFLLWLGYYLLVAGTLSRLYLPNREELRHGLLRQALYYFCGYFRGGPNPHQGSPQNKFNPLQKSAYLVVMMLLMPMVILSGALLLNIGPLRELILMIGGLKSLAELHFLLACCLVAFLFTHVYLATLGHTPFAHFVPMWTGWEEVEPPADQPCGERGPARPEPF